jgi:8-oxo-dGTP diphosphatase
MGQSFAGYSGELRDVALPLRCSAVFSSSIFADNRPGSVEVSSPRAKGGVVSTSPGSASASVAAAVIVDGGQALLIRRAVQEGRLSWQFPAGKVEPGESADEAAVREALEETGLAVRPTGLIGERIHPDTGRRMLYVACDVTGGTAYAASPDEVAEMAWCDRAAIAEFIPYPLYAPVQRHLDDRLR